MNAREVCLEKFFHGPVVYVTPTFQRPFGAPARGRVGRMLDALERERPFFLGGAVTRDLGRPDSGCKKKLLIDGNQRLQMTLMVMLALRDALGKADAEAAGRIDDACFLRQGAGAAQLKSLVLAADRAAFESLVLGKPAPDAGHPLVAVHTEAGERFAAYSVERLRAAADRMLQRFTLVEIALAKGDDPYPIYKLVNPTDDATTRMGLAAYGKFSQDPELMDLVAGGESQEVEFKAHTIVPAKHREDGKVQGVGSVVRAVAAMLNSATGGTLLIGVEDNGSICGIEDEYAVIDRGKSNWDGYQLYLANVLRTRLDSSTLLMHYEMERRTAGGHDVCLIRVKPSDVPVYLDKRLYVRTLNQTVEMLGPDLIAFVAKRYPARTGE